MKFSASIRISLQASKFKVQVKWKNQQFIKKLRFRIDYRKMEYETKAYLTTILATYIVPICLGLGMTLETANAFVGLIVCLVPMIASMLSEMWESKHLSRPKPSENGDNAPVGVVLDDTVEDSPVYESEYLEMSNIGDETA